MPSRPTVIVKMARARMRFRQSSFIQRVIEVAHVSYMPVCTRLISLCPVTILNSGSVKDSHYRWAEVRRGVWICHKMLSSRFMGCRESLATFISTIGRSRGIWRCGCYVWYLCGARHGRLWAAYGGIMEPLFHDPNNWYRWVSSHYNPPTKVQCNRSFCAFLLQTLVTACAHHSHQLIRMSSTGSNSYCRSWIPWLAVSSRSSAILLSASPLLAEGSWNHRYIWKGSNIKHAFFGELLLNRTPSTPFLTALQILYSSANSSMSLFCLASMRERHTKILISIRDL